MIALRQSLLGVSLAFALVAAPGLAAQAEKPAAPQFTRAQADAGEALFTRSCATCHGAQLEGGAGAALRGSTFTARWGGQPVAALFGKISTEMPLNAPASLPKPDYLALAAYILSRNGAAAGAAPLDEAGLDSRIVAAARPPGAPHELPKIALPASPVSARRASTSRPLDAELTGQDPANWLMYNRDYRGQRYSELAQINARNAARLHAVCMFQLGEIGSFSPNPVVYDGALYVTVKNKTFSIDARSCRRNWLHEYATDEEAIISPNRGVAVYRGAVYRTISTGHLIALDAKTGELLWDVWMSSVARGYWASAAPVAFDGQVIVGDAGADAGAPGHLYSFDAASGKRLWTFNYIPARGEPGYDTWEAGTEHGGGSNWSSYAIDVENGLVYAPVGNPAPDFDASPRRGTNLYTNSVVAVDLKSGALAWYAQQAPADTHDWDTGAAPVLYEQGGRRFMAVANKGGWLYLYDRDSHQLIAQPEVSTHLNQASEPDAAGIYTCPGIVGGVEWNGPAYSPREGALFVNSVDWCGTFARVPRPVVEGQLNPGGRYTWDPIDKAYGWVRAFDASSGAPRWSYRSATPMVAGVTPTAGGVLFTGDLNGEFMVLDCASGKLLYRFNTGGAIAGGVITYAVEGRQYIAVPSGTSSRTTWKVEGSPTIVVFALEP